MDLGVNAEVKAELVQEIGTRFYEQYTDRLIPSEDYGRLIPYAGLRTTFDSSWEDGSYIYGLITRDGAVVVDPVYSGVSAPGYTDIDGIRRNNPILLLREYGSGLMAAAAFDGSWFTDFIYRQATSDPDGIVLVSDEGMTVMAPNGSIDYELSRAGMGVSVEDWEMFLDMLHSDLGMCGCRRGDYIVISDFKEGDNTYYHCYTLSTGQFTDIYKYAFWDLHRTASLTFDEYAPSPVLDAVSRPDSLLGWEADYILISPDPNCPSRCICYRSDGTPLPELTYMYDGSGYPFKVFLEGGIAELLETNCASYYDLETMRCIFRTPLRYIAD